MFENLLFLLLFLSIGGLTSNATSNTWGVVGICTNEEFRCKNNQCIAAELECNGKEDCYDGSDEFDYECKFKFCKPPTFYKCKDKNETCITSTFRCDGHNDCPLNDDEQNCTNYTPHHEKTECNADEFTCLADGMCLPMVYVCDSDKQCVDGSDEAMGCLEIGKCKGFLCTNKRCLTDRNWLCDGANDCGDWSDEINCHSDCTSDNRHFLCNDNQTCLPIERACNKKNECPDNSDEGGICSKFTNNTACDAHYCPSEASCYIWPTGPVCVCPKGFLYNTKKKICEDIDECQKYGICSQGCVNTPGSYRCTCVANFYLKNNNKTCESISHVEPLLLYAQRKSIYMIHLKSDHRSTVTDKGRQVVGLTYDGHYVYWTNVALNTESIVKARPDGTKLETLLTTGLSLPEDIAIDWITGNLYFTDALYMHIAVCSNDARQCTSLVHDGVDKPRSIALYPQEGRMYWSEWGLHPMIAIAHMDGSFAAPFIHENVQWPSGVTLDWPNNRLYWIDAKLSKIESINLDGTGRHTVIEHVLKHPYGLAVFENRIYWSDWKAMSVESCNKFNCKDRKTIVKDRKVYDIHIYHSSIQPIVSNPCRQHKCTHLCLLASNSTYTCGCPTGTKLNADKTSCTAELEKESIYIGLKNYLITLEHEIFGRHQVEKAKELPFYIHKLAFNPRNGHVFIVDNFVKIIYDYEMKHNYPVELVKKNIGRISSLAFDYLSNNLYWSDTEHGTIDVLSLNTNSRATVYHYMGMAKPISIAVIPEVGYMYVAVKSNIGHTHIDIQSLYGFGTRHHLIESQIGDGSIQFAVDGYQNDVYWTDSNLRKISSMHFTGQNHNVFRLVPSEPLSLAVLAEDIFWTKKNSLNIIWTPKHSPDEMKLLILPKYDYVTKDDEIVLVAAQRRIVEGHPCMTNNGNCSHICLTKNITQAICLCPAGMVFVNSKNVTCMEAVDCEFRCDSGECISSSRRCNNIKDCDDGSDELNCKSNSEVYCYQDQFKCADGNQCISIELRCNKHDDCKDKSDEKDCKNVTHCHPNQFHCSNGLCIDEIAVCDQVNDCENGEDEKFCHNKKLMKKVCKADKFMCATGQCISLSWVCDDTPDCYDGSDEHDCPEKICPVGYIKCTHGQCLDAKLVCDGFNNCGDNSDEENCTQTEPSEMNCAEFDSNMEPTKFACPSDKTICLNITAQCNGTTECPRGEDEAHCTNCRINEFECHDKKCIRKEWRCDKTLDCQDGSDEIDCNKETTGIMSVNCLPGMFDCLDGHCIDNAEVCNGRNDCPSKRDESSTCEKSCLKHPCSQVCTKSPFGPKCSCQEGYTMGSDGITCYDINECVEFDPCAQKCVNTHGGFRCGCFAGFMLRQDKVSCKSVGGPKHILYSSLNVIYNISSTSLGILWSSNTSKITGMDVNVRKNLLYFSIQDTYTLYELNMENGKITYLSNIGNPQFVAVDWTTNNVYFYDQNTNPSIKICQMSRKVCLKIIQLKYRDVVKSLVVDSVNDKIFYTILHPSFSNSESFVYSHSLDGSHQTNLIKGSNFINGLTYDPNKQILFYSDLATDAIYSIKYNGTGKKSLIKDNSVIARPFALSFHEDHLLILNMGSKKVAQCKMYGDRECQSFELNAYNAENVVTVHESRQLKKDDICDGRNCSYLCVPSKAGPKCLCHGLIFVKEGTGCDHSNEVGMAPNLNEDVVTKNPSNSNIGVRIFNIVAICIISTVLVFGAFYVYALRNKGRRTFNISMHYNNPQSLEIDNAQVSMLQKPQFSTSNRYNEICLNTQVPTISISQDGDNFSTDREDDTTRLLVK